MAFAYDEIFALVRQMPIPTPWNRDIFVADVAAIRGRPITLVPTDTADLLDSPCGLWLSREADDLILHETGTSQYHIDQIVCHEIGHMILGHDKSQQEKGREGNLDQMWRAILPDLDPETVSTVLGRSRYTNDQEREAEMFASLLMDVATETTSAPPHSMMRSVFFHHR